MDTGTVRRDLESRGYRVTPAYQYGCHLAVYSKDSKHSDYLIYVINEDTMSMTDLGIVAIARIAHTVNKTIMIALPLSKGGVRYWELKSWDRFPKVR